METWKKVPNTEGKIEVSDHGRVRSLLRGTPYILKTQKDAKGYLRVSVTINRVKRTYKVHRLVAQQFLPESDLPQINHIDGNKENNHDYDLEYVNNADNARHAIEHGLWDSVIAGSIKENEKRKKTIKAFNEKEEKYFNSISEAERYFNSRHITDVLKGKRSHVKGWSFSYIERG